MGGCTSAEVEEYHKNNNKDEDGGNVGPKPDFETRWKDDIISIWGRPLAKLPVHTDVPRLSKKMTIKSEAGDAIFDGTDAKYKSTSNTAVTKILIVSIAKALDDKELRNQLKNWDSLVPDSGDTGEHVLAFFNSVTAAGGETATLLVLKAIHQRLIFPAFYCLKDLLQNSVGRFKDKTGTWISHQKEQQAVNSTPKGEPEFGFEWALILTIDVLNKNISKDILIKLSNIEVSADLSADRRKQIEAAFDKYKTVN